MHHFTLRNTLWLAGGPPAVIQINNTSRHNPRHPKTIEKKTPNNGSHITMNKKVVHRLPISFAHATYVHHDNVLPPKIIQGEDLA
jgi:hypothetical protein